MKNRRFLGDLDADRDNSFSEHFVESPYLTRIKTNESDIIYGLKGVGKTALRRALTEFEPDFFYSSKIIDLGSISFETLLKSLRKLNDTTNVEVPNLARCVWMNNLVHYGLDTLADCINDRDIKERITTVLRKEKFISPSARTADNQDSANRKILAQVERIFEYIIEFGIEETSKVTHLDLSSDQLNVFNVFPLNMEIQDILLASSSSFKKSNKKIVICLDGFDSIIDHTPDSRKAIFAGLIDSIARFRIDNLISQIFCYKAFLPKELTADAENMGWDSDKIAYNVHSLKWTKSEFEIFLEKRLFTYSRKRSSKFSDLWPEYMPEKLINPVHGVEENTFDYILRHTLGRPRQVLMHIQNILDRWDEKFSSFRIDPSFIPQVVAETNNTMARQVSSQLEKVYPNMQAFLKSWHNSPCIMTFYEFKERLKTYFSEFNLSELNKLIDDLFGFGLLGIMSNTDFNKQSGKKFFKFGFSDNGAFSNIHITARDDDYLAFCPMFREYCGFNSSEHGIIMTN